MWKRLHENRYVISYYSSLLKTSCHNNNQMSHVYYESIIEICLFKILEKRSLQYDINNVKVLWLRSNFALHSIRNSRVLPPTARTPIMYSVLSNKRKLSQNANIHCKHAHRKLNLRNILARKRRSRRIKYIFTDCFSWK